MFERARWGGVGHAVDSHRTAAAAIVSASSNDVIDTIGNVGSNAGNALSDGDGAAVAAIGASYCCTANASRTDYGTSFDEDIAASAVTE